jgi:signal transduction histidine kinase
MELRVIRVFPDTALVLATYALYAMLHEFLTANRSEILDRSRTKLTRRDAPTPTASELESGLPLFLDQLVAILRVKGAGTAENASVAASAALHGGELLRMGLTVGQVVEDYGSICQSVTELAEEKSVPIAADEFQTFNRCLDEATAQAVTEYERQRDRTVGSPGVAHLGFLAHEMRNLLSTSILTFDALRKGTVGVLGSTGTLHARSLRRMRALIDRTLAEVRLGADIQTSERVSVAQLIEEIAIIAAIDAKEYDKRLSIDAGPHEMAVQGDPQILASAVANLVQNAFKFTPARGQVTVRAYRTGDRAHIEVRDECGGLPPGKLDELFWPFQQRGSDKTGLGLGLSISLKGVRASGGEIHVRDLPGVGCVFTIDLPICEAAF